MVRGMVVVSLPFASSFPGASMGMRRYSSGSRYWRWDVIRCCAHLGQGISISVKWGEFTLVFSRGIAVLGEGGGMGLLACSERSVAGMVCSGFACVTAGVERILSREGRDRFIAGVRRWYVGK